MTHVWLTHEIDTPAVIVNISIVKRNLIKWLVSQKPQAFTFAHILKHTK